MKWLVRDPGCDHSVVVEARSALAAARRGHELIVEEFQGDTTCPECESVTMVEVEVSRYVEESVRRFRIGDSWREIK